MPPANSVLKRKYGITFDDYLSMLGKQGHSCAICKAPFKKPDGTLRRICVDHCHSCKKVRGLLCYQCNRYVVAKNNQSSAWHLKEYLLETEDSCEAANKWEMKMDANME